MSVATRCGVALVDSRWKARSAEGVRWSVVGDRWAGAWAVERFLRSYRSSLGIRQAGGAGMREVGYVSVFNFAAEPGGNLVSRVGKSESSMTRTSSTQRRSRTTSREKGNPGRRGWPWLLVSDRHTVAPSLHCRTPPTSISPVHPFFPFMRPAGLPRASPRVHDARTAVDCRGGSLADSS